MGHLIQLKSIQNIIVIGNGICIVLIVLTNIVLLYGSWKICKENKYLPLVVKVVNLIKEGNIKKQNVYRTINQLNVCDDGVEYTRKYYYKKYTLVVWIVLIMNVLSMVVILLTQPEKKLINNQYILRPAYGGVSENVELEIKLQDKQGNIDDAEMNIEVLPNRLNTFQERKLIEQVKKYIYKKVLGSNSSYNKVDSKLNLITSYSKDNNISITWRTDEYGIINYKGNIDYSYFEKHKVGDKIDVTITAIIEYFDNKYEYVIELVVCKPIKDLQTSLKSSLEDKIAEENNNHSLNNIMELPRKIDNYTVTYSEKEKNEILNNWVFVMCISVLCIAIVIKYKDSEFNKDIQTKNEQLIIYYGEIVNKLKMLVIAGLTVEAAWNRICRDYLEDKRQNKYFNYAYEELLYTNREIELGVSSIEAYRRFGIRVALGPYVRLSSLIIQNIKSGTEKFIDALDLEVKAIEGNRKEMFIKKGGEVGTKLLLPMMIMMGLTLLIVMVPALMTM